MAKEKRPLKSTTRTFLTTAGELTYPELSALIAPKLAKLWDDIVDEKYRTLPLDESLILTFHEQIIGDIIPEIAGQWRKVPVQVGNLIPPEPFEVPILMHEYVQNISMRLKHATSFNLQVDTLVYAEGEFLHIHPFQDFNGRTIRALLVEIQARLNFPLVETAVARETADFRRYQNALAEYDNHRSEALQDFWLDRISKSNERNDSETAA